VYFNANGATGASPEPMQRDSGSVISLPDQAGMTKDQNRFVGWNTKADGNGKTYETYAKYTVNGTTTLYAKWTPKTYTLTINPATGGTTSPGQGQRTYNAGTEVTVTANAATAQNYTFVEWTGASESPNPDHNHERG